MAYGLYKPSAVTTSDAISGDLVRGQSSVIVTNYPGIGAGAGLDALCEYFLGLPLLGLAPPYFPYILGLP